MQRNLFGVPVPPGAVRVTIRPVLGRGGAMPLHKQSLDDGPLDEDEIIASASKNAAFWDYIDSRTAGKDAEAASCSWKLRLQFFDQQQAEESFTTEQAITFYRSASLPQVGKADDTRTQAWKTLRSSKRSTDKTLRRLHKSTADALAGMTAASLKAIEEASKAAAASVAESSKAAGNALAEASKQTTVVSELAKALLAEASELKEGIFELQTERAKAPKEAPKGIAQEVRDVVDAGKSIMTLVETIGGAVSNPTPAAAEPGPTGAKNP